MMKLLKFMLPVAAVSLLLSGCATIIGGTNYNAHVVVKGSPNAKVSVNDIYRGTGTLSFPVRRKDADRLIIKVQEEGCEEQTFRFTSRSFRGWAFVGTLLVCPTPMPWGVVIDLSTGALWKPNVMENGVLKLDHKNFQYVINYTGNKQQPAAPEAGAGPASDKFAVDARTSDPLVLDKPLIDVIYLNNGSVVKGIIVEQTPNVHLKMRTLDNDIFVFRFEDIDKIIKENLE